MTSKHPKMNTDQSGGGVDVKKNPGIGTSKGAFATGTDPLELEGDNTVEGDVANDTTPEGGVDPNQMGRTNK